MRPGEAYGLQRKDLDFEKCEIRVERTLSINRLGTPKTGRSRRAVDMSQSVREVLRQVEIDQKKETLARGWSEIPPWVFTTTEGTPLDRNAIARRFKRVLKAAGLPRHYTPHGLRHTFASQLIQQGESVTYVQRQLGHTSIRQTVDCYGRWLPMGNRAAVDRLDDPVVSPGKTRSGSKMVANGPDGGRRQSRRRSQPVDGKPIRIGGAAGDRTPDLVTASHALSQLSYSPT